MCGKSSKSSPPPPAPAPAPVQQAVADTSNMQQKVAATNDTASTMQSFGSELGGGSTTTAQAGA